MKYGWIPDSIKFVHFNIWKMIIAPSTCAHSCSNWEHFCIRKPSDDPIIFVHFDDDCKNDWILCACKSVLSFLSLYLIVILFFSFLMRSMFYPILVATSHGRNWIIRRRGLQTIAMHKLRSNFNVTRFFAAPSALRPIIKVIVCVFCIESYIIVLSWPGTLFFIGSRSLSFFGSRSLPFFGSRFLKKCLQFFRRTRIC